MDENLNHVIALYQRSQLGGNCRSYLANRHGRLKRTCGLRRRDRGSGLRSRIGNGLLFRHFALLQARQVSRGGKAVRESLKLWNV